MAHQIGVGIALGTDAPLVLQGQNAAERVEYVNAGMTPMEALMTGTVNAAQVGGIEAVANSSRECLLMSWHGEEPARGTSTQCRMLDLS